ncbi:MAG: peptidoglycan DD-metalloendopeptidase family protein [Ghiorsea sp.]
MNIFLHIICLSLLLSFASHEASAARDVQTELQSIQKQRQLAVKAQKELNQELGAVGASLKALDVSLLQARKAYRNVKHQIADIDKRLKKLSASKRKIRKKMRKLYKQMAQEASIAYQHTGSQSVWVDMLSGSSITEIPHRQHLLKQVMQSQGKDRQAWQEATQEIAAIEDKENAQKAKLLALQQERKDAETVLVAKLGTKRKAAKQLRIDLKAQQKHSLRLKKQELALQRLLNDLDDSLLASDKSMQHTSIRKKKGKLPWPLKGRIVLGFGKKTVTGAKLSGVHISPARRSEEGKLVRALGQGQVRYADWFGGYGLMMIVDYRHGIMAVYAHHDALHNQLGDWVEKGEVLAEAGSTGWIEDVRLYFEIREKGKPVNPVRWCKKKK